MVLQLDDNILKGHIQKYANSCVPMGIELVLKLMGQVKINYYDLQDEKGDKSRSGGDFEDRQISNVKIKTEFNYTRNPDFPLDKLFERIIDELKAHRFVNCAWKEKDSDPFHAFIIYGYNDDELLAITKYQNDPITYYIPDMKSRLTKIQGSDIITYQIVST